MPLPPTLIADDGDWSELLQTEGFLKKYPFLNAQVKDTTTCVYERTYQIERANYTPAAALSQDPDDSTAYLVFESEPVAIGGDTVQVVRQYAKIPTDQVSYHSRPFARPNLHGFTNGTLWGVSFDDGETSHVFSSSNRKAATIGSVPSLVTNRARESFGPDVFDGGHLLTISDGSISTTVTLTSSASAIASALELFFSTDVTVVISPTECQISFGKDMEQFSVSSDELELAGSAALVTVKRRQTAQYAESTDTTAAIDSVRTVTCASHGGAAGNKVALYNNNKILCLTHVVAVPGSGSFTIPLADLSDKDAVVTHAVFAKDGTRLVNGEKDCTIRVTQKFYLPGVTVGITTGADVPSTPLYRDPIAWLDQIDASADYSAINVSELGSWMGPILQKVIEEVQMADALEGRDAAA